MCCIEEKVVLDAFQVPDLHLVFMGKAESCMTEHASISAAVQPVFWPRFLTVDHVVGPFTGSLHLATPCSRCVVGDMLTTENANQCHSMQ